MESKIDMDINQQEERQKSIKMELIIKIALGILLGYILIVLLPIIIPLLLGLLALAAVVGISIFIYEWFDLDWLGFLSNNNVCYFLFLYWYF